MCDFSIFGKAKHSLLLCILRYVVRLGISGCLVLVALRLTPVVLA